MSTTSTKLPSIHARYCEVALDILQGEPVLIENTQGHRVPLIENGKVVRKYTAACLREVREFLKDNHIDQEPIEGTAIHDVAKAITHFEDEADPLLDDH